MSSVEPLHLFRYLNEQAYRFNDKGCSSTRFRAVTEKRLSYMELRGKLRGPKYDNPPCSTARLPRLEQPVHNRPALLQFLLQRQNRRASIVDLAFDVLNINYARNLYPEIQKFVRIKSRMPLS